MPNVTDNLLYNRLSNITDGYEGAAAEKLRYYENELVKAINQLLSKYDQRKSKHHNTTDHGTLFSSGYFHKTRKAQEVTTAAVHITHPFLPLAAITAAANIGSFAAGGIGHLCNGINNFTHRKLINAHNALKFFGDNGEVRERLIRIIARLIIHEAKDKLVHLKTKSHKNMSVAMYLAANALHGIKKYAPMMEITRDEDRLIGAVNGVIEGLTNPSSSKVKNHGLDTDNGESLSLKQLARHRL